MINDTYGHAIGDKLLKAIAIRLRENLQHKGLLARFGGDEFIIQVEHRNVQNTPSFAKDIIAKLNKPFHLKEVGELSIGCSIDKESAHRASKQATHTRGSCHQHLTPDWR